MTTAPTATAPAPGEELEGLDGLDVLATGRAPRSVDERIERLSQLSARRVVEPDVAVPGHVGDGIVIAPELLAIAPLGLDLTPEQVRILGREELASVALVGVRFEAALTAGFALDLVRRVDLVDPRVTYILHELGEETRHSRLFLRMIADLAPTARNPLERYLGVIHRIVRWAVCRPVLFVVLVLTGEEIPDLLQKRLAEHPGTDPFVRAVNRYHRQEEARHINFARLLLPELWKAASHVERFLVRRGAPLMIDALFDALVHPGVYAAAGLPGWKTWRAVQAAPERKALRHEAIRPLLAALTEAGAFRAGRIPRGWRRSAGVDRHGAPVAARG